MVKSRNTIYKSYAGIKFSLQPLLKATRYVRQNSTTVVKYRATTNLLRIVVFNTLLFIFNRARQLIACWLT
ncbi:GSCOCG00011880001-RA-CDS, partial [Cotesia congregata]